MTERTQSSKLQVSRGELRHRVPRCWRRGQISLVVGYLLDLCHIWKWRPRDEVQLYGGVVKHLLSWDIYLISAIFGNRGLRLASEPSRLRTPTVAALLS